jgi:hypothetical protein
MGAPDIFVSYAREDQARVAPVVAALEARGWSVFWDRRIPPGQTWRSHIGRALERARCVVVAWSEHSILSEWVIEEADDGRERGILVPAFLDPVRPPRGFRGIQAADLSGWSPERPSPAFDSFLSDLHAVLGAPHPGPSPPPSAAGISLAKQVPDAGDERTTLPQGAAVAPASGDDAASSLAGGTVDAPRASKTSARLAGQPTAAVRAPTGHEAEVDPAPLDAVPAGQARSSALGPKSARFRGATVIGVGLGTVTGVGLGTVAGIGIGIGAGVGLTVAGAVVAVPRIVARIRARARAIASVPREEAPKTSDGSTIITMPAAVHASPRAIAEPAAPDAQPVDAAVFCPPRVAKGSIFLVQVFLYPPGTEHEAAVQAREADITAERRGTYSLPLDLPPGTRVDVRLEMPDLVVAEPDAILIWRGKPTANRFEVAVPADTTGANAIGRVRIAVDGIPVGTLRFKLELGAAGMMAAATAQCEAKAVRYHRAFVSYSSQDRAEVLRRVQAFRIAGLSVFQDVLDLDPGERWERALYREIAVCDVFLLFWSRAAAASERVAKEIAYALTLKAGSDDRPPAIQPVPIEGPPPPPPPDTLRHLHFNDALLAQIQAASARPAYASTP